MINPDKLYIVNIDTEAYSIGRPAAIYVVSPNVLSQPTTLDLPISPSPKTISPGESFTITNLNPNGLNLIFDQTQGAVHITNPSGLGIPTVGQIPYLGTATIHYLGQIGGDPLEYWLIEGSISISAN